MNFIYLSRLMRAGLNDLLTINVAGSQENNSILKQMATRFFDRELKPTNKPIKTSRYKRSNVFSYINKKPQFKSFWLGCELEYKKRSHTCL